MFNLIQKIKGIELLLDTLGVFIWNTDYPIRFSILLLLLLLVLGTAVSSS